jgi:nitroreductase
MSNLAAVQSPVHDLIRRRWSPRAFAERPVEPEKLRTLFEAARWAASCYNEQPWSFLVATKDDPEAYRRLYDTLVSGNQKWAESAPVLAVSVARLAFERNGKPNRHAWHDVGLAMGNLCLQATALNLYVHQMQGFDPEKVRLTCAVPQGHAPVAAIAIGYLGDPARLPDDLREREAAPRDRRPLDRFVFSARWDRAAGWVAG